MQEPKEDKFMKLRNCYPIVALSLLLPSAALAETNYEYAAVVEARPVYQVVEVQVPQEQCWEEDVAVDRQRRSSNSNTGVLLSTIIGGAIGNAVGHNKSNRRVGTVVGAVLGHSVGRDIIRSNSQPAVREYQKVQRCETVYDEVQEERLVGYDVTYLYQGEERSIRTSEDPGEQIRLRVDVQPVL